LASIVSNWGRDYLAIIASYIATISVGTFEPIVKLIGFSYIAEQDKPLKSDFIEIMYEMTNWAGISSEVYLLLNQLLCRI
jgi:hypothetical protein